MRSQIIGTGPDTRDAVDLVNIRQCRQQWVTATLLAL